MSVPPPDDVGTGSASAAPRPCPQCGDAVAVGSRFCESCGYDVDPRQARPRPGSWALTASPIEDSASPPTGPAGSEDAATVPVRPAAAEPDPLGDETTVAVTPVSQAGLADAPTGPAAPPGPSGPAEPVERPQRTCVECGGPVGADDYCLSCGIKAADPRDHVEQAPSPWVAGVSDKGRRRRRNEDALAVATDRHGEGHTVLVVCDGVATSTESAQASRAGAEAACAVLRAPMPGELAVERSRAVALARFLARAAEAANDAVIAQTDAEADNPASATFVAVLAADTEVVVGWLGDSRAYWVGDCGTVVQLSVDDSGANARIAAGEDPGSAQARPDAHAITRWLGADAPDIEPQVVTHRPDGPGWAIACSDGLWGYLQGADHLAALVRQVAPRPDAGAALSVARALVDFANAAGGRDNITVALARVAAPDIPSETSDPTDPTETENAHG